MSVLVDLNDPRYLIMKSIEILNDARHNGPACSCEQLKEVISLLVLARGLDGASEET